MERILSVEQMRNADNFTINSLGVSEDELVERAGGAVANEIRQGRMKSKQGLDEISSR
jgi:NAD(P)H-hydrate repair Nnr-like enzyme with NAD(P)H-hydrate epimerase domain